MEYEIVGRDGNRRMIQWDNTVLRTPMRDVLGTASLGADVTEARAQEETVKLLHSITLAIGTAHDLNSALETTLRSICRAAGWGYGEAWMPTPDGQRLERTAYYASDAERVQSLIKGGGRLTRAPSEGLPGRAWQSKTVEWIRDLQDLKDDS